MTTTTSTPDLDLRVGLAENTEPQCPVVICADTSGSMMGEPIEALNRGLAAFREVFEKDPLAASRVEARLVTFGSSVDAEGDWSEADEFNPAPLRAGGMTALGAGLTQALELIEDRKRYYKSNDQDYFRPILLLLTDGAPTDDWGHAAERLRQAVEAKGVTPFIVGVEGANFDILKQIAPPNLPPAKLTGLNFEELFVWLSASASAVSSAKPGEQVPLPGMGWGEVQA
jgi:uncharacterized protein YegL